MNDAKHLIAIDPANASAVAVHNALLIQCRMHAQVAVEFAIKSINSSLWRQLGGYVSLNMANAIHADPGRLLDADKLLLDLLYDNQTRKLDPGEQRIICAINDVNWIVSVYTPIKRRLEAILNAALDVRVAPHWNYTKQAILDRFTDDGKVAEFLNLSDGYVIKRFLLIASYEDTRYDDYPLQPRITTTRKEVAIGFGGYAQCKQFGDQVIMSPIIVREELKGRLGIEEAIASIRDQALFNQQ